MSENAVTELERCLSNEEPAEAFAIGKFFPERVPDLGTIEAFDTDTIGPMKVSTAVSPDCSFRLLKRVIDSSTTTLDIYIYNIGAEHIVETIREAASRGVRIRVMYDTSDDGANETTLLEGLAGVEAKVAPMARPRSVFTVCHQKFVVADNERMLLGSANWASTSYPNATRAGQFKKGNREWVIAVENGGIAKWYADLFQTDWDIPEFDDPGHLFGEEKEQLPDILVPMAAVKIPDVISDIEDFSHPVKLTPLISPVNYFDVVSNLIKNATLSIDVQQQSLKSALREDGSVDGTKRVNQLLQMLQDKKAEGVKIRLMVSPKFSWQDSLAAVRNFGLEEDLRAISLDTFTHLHNKGLVIDGNKAVVTSTNWTDNSMSRAREAGFLIEDDTVAAYYQKVFDLDWDQLSFAPDELPHHLVAVLQDALNEPGEVAAMHPGEFIS